MKRRGGFSDYAFDNTNSEPCDSGGYTTTALTVNLTLTDVWNVTVFQDTGQEVAEFIDVVASVYTLVIHNQQDYACYAIIEHAGRNHTFPDIYDIHR